MSDRIEEYRQDWVAGSVPDRRKGRSNSFRPRTPYFWYLTLVVVLLAVVTLGYDVYHQRDAWERKMDDKVRIAETDLEMAVVARLLRQYHVANNCLPPDPIDYASANMKKNKPYPPGCDFWGQRYLLERESGGFVIRSAGPNRKYFDRDDLLYSSGF